MPFDSDHTRRVAKLARLAIPESEIDAVGVELQRVLQLFEQLRDTAIVDVEPMAHPLGMALSLRDDVISEGDQRDTLLALAPETRDGLYIVPKVIE
ncbi:MAG: Asp-tRNA(Asn)/Glu-tRNA(Gln) amidotransferase subunit GatC [Dokdonella sp.]